jgi:hypothetical protein
MFALGQLGLKPWEFERYTIHDFMMAWFGYQETLRIQRIQTLLTIRASSGADLEPRDLWPLYFDEPRVNLKKLERLAKQAEINWK